MDLNSLFKLLCIYHDSYLYLYKYLYIKLQSYCRRLDLEHISFEIYLEQILSSEQVSENTELLYFFLISLHE